MRMTIKEIGLAVVLLTSVGATAAEADRIAVVDFEAAEAERPMAATLQEFVAQEVGRQRKDEVLTGKDIAELLKTERTKMVAETASEGNQSRIAKALDADYLVSGAVVRQEGGYMLTLRLLDAKASKSAGRETGLLKGNGTDLIPQVAQLVRKLFGAQGMLILLNQVPGATVYLNGQKAGTMPLAKVPVRQAGTYQLRIEHDQYAPYERVVDVSPGTNTRLAPKLWSYVEIEERAQNRRVWGWSLSGAGLAVAAVGGWQIASAQTTRSEYEEALAQRVPADQAVAQRDRLSRLNDDANRGYVTGQVIGGAGAGVLVTGLYLLFVNPWESMAEGVAGISPSATIGPEYASVGLRVELE